MTRTRIAAALAVSLVAGAAIAQQAQDSAGSLERRVEQIEQAVARLQSKPGGRQAGGMMEGCREMMGGEMMRGGRRMRRAPNDQWRGSPAR
ncbi:MAG: hypothetical protein HY661_10300 [Betaproteobacteria bacterium]|nr:hypothetical protein [Betaproteobacteria bacterium]